MERIRESIYTNYSTKKSDTFSIIIFELDLQLLFLEKNDEKCVFAITFTNLLYVNFFVVPNSIVTMWNGLYGWHTVSGEYS